MPRYIKAVLFSAVLIGVNAYCVVRTGFSLWSIVVGIGCLVGSVLALFMHYPVKPASSPKYTIKDANTIISLAKKAVKNIEDNSPPPDDPEKMKSVNIPTIDNLDTIIDEVPTTAQHLITDPSQLPRSFIADPTHTHGLYGLTCTWSVDESCGAIIRRPTPEITSSSNVGVESKSRDDN